MKLPLAPPGWRAGSSSTPPPERRRCCRGGLACRSRGAGRRIGEAWSQAGSRKGGQNCAKESHVVSPSFWIDVEGRDGAAALLLYSKQCREPSSMAEPRTDDDAHGCHGCHGCAGGRGCAARPQGLRERGAARPGSPERALRPPRRRQAVARLAGEGIVNDARYAENYVTYNAGRGHGPIRIGCGPARPRPGAGADRGGARQRARLARARTPGARAPVSASSRPASWRETARQGRFLQYRGFSSDHIRAATGRRSRHGLKELGQTHLHERGGSARVRSWSFSRAEPHDRAVELAGAAQRSDAAVHQRRHGAVQGRVPRQGGSATICAP